MVQTVAAGRRASLLRAVHRLARRREAGCFQAWACAASGVCSLASVSPLTAAMQDQIQKRLHEQPVAALIVALSASIHPLWTALHRC